MERVLITGASRGIGRALALRLARPGRQLLLHGRAKAALEDTARQVEERGGGVTVHVADLADPAQVEALAAAVGGQPLSALVHNAGLAVAKPVAEVSEAEWRQSLEVNLTAPFLLTRALLPHLSHGATVVHVLSVAAKRGFAGWAPYCAAKFALEGFSQCLREEVRGLGVRVVNVYPAATATQLWDGVAGQWPRERMLAAEEVAEAIAFALERPGEVVVSDLSLSHLAGTL